ncbi:MAG TPA: DUF6600 domain-containing protein [Chthoniobacterales bacterium]|nr:DUF6600 domain-containing protein [Chthoniobacterales bacterium]
MKSICLLALAAACAFSVGSCNKQPSPAEHQAAVDREVQRRLDAEHQAAAQGTIDQRQAELDVRERALREKENRLAATATPAPPEPTARPMAPPRGEVVATPNEPDADSSYSTFYQRLDPYGAWIETSNYGFVFQPRDVFRDSNWRPYIQGHWVYTDVGWTWISSEPFGWATYHYGRWARLRSVGWVWVPGEEWAPAWVSWRRGDDFVGWAPLPPKARFNRQTGIHNWSDSRYGIGPEQYTFVPVQEFGGPQSAQVIVASSRNVTIIEQTTNVTNITYVNSTVVDRGPSFDDLRARSRHQIQKFKLERTQNFNAEQPVIRGEVVAMPTRDFRPAPKTARPVRVERTITQPAVERGWQDVKDPQVAQKLRQKMEREATSPAGLPKRQPVAETAETPAPTATAPPPIVRPEIAAPSTAAPQPALAPQQETRRDRIQEKRRERRQLLQQQKQQQATPAPQDSATAAPTVPAPATPAPKGRRPGPQPNQP